MAPNPKVAIEPAAAGKKKPIVRSTTAQIRYLVRYMGQHPEFAAGDFRGPLGFAANEAEWGRLKSALDELGPDRSIIQWKNAWRDQKKKARAEGGAINKKRLQTGNNTVVPSISENSEIILGTIGCGMAVGIGPEESSVGYQEQTLEARCSSPPTVPEANEEVIIVPHTSSLEARRNIRTVRGRKRVRHENPPERFLQAQKENNGLLKELIEKAEEANFLRREKLLLLEEANSVNKEKLEKLNKIHEALKIGITAAAPL